MRRAGVLERDRGRGRGQFEEVAAVLRGIAASRVVTCHSVIVSGPSSTEQAVGLLMEGLLLSYFRATHKRGGSLHVLRDYRIALPQGHDAVVDFAVVDGDSGEPVAIFQVATTANAVRSRRRVLESLRAAFADAPSMPLLGLVVPERLASGEVVGETEDAGVEVVTYAA